MASTSSVSGLVSGLDTTTLISQLMQVEAQPQTLLKNKLSTEKSTLSSLQGLNAKFAALATKAADLAKASAWTPAKATSSSTYATANAASTAAPGTFGFTVKQTATATQLSFSSTPKATDVVAAGGLTLTVHGGTPISIDTGDGTIGSVVAAINTKGAGVTATALKLDDGSYRLRVVSDTTGAGSDVTLTQADGSALLGGATATAGRDAQITVGADTVSSSTNTFTGISTGLDVTLAPGTPANTAVDMTITRDQSAAQTSLQGLVDAANDLLTQIDTLTKYDASTKTAGALVADATVRSLRDRVLDTVTKAADGSTMASLGVQTDRYGKIVFDTATFAKAYAADPTSVVAKLGAASTATVPGFASRLQAMAKAASDSVSGTLTLSIQSRQSTVTSLQDRIDDWDTRLAAKKDALTTQFTHLEVALSKLQSQASWLSGQINSLSSSSSS
ncbi:MAG: flagellar filament capping protein FliD [Nocardioidaceae bacterium]|nr:flagellar filament capping protein FliD [Nocardioidaceae bacterium]NUS50558.1 flagellar filament capping protein FliD [Nocardioidaceae bacterium]